MEGDISCHLWLVSGEGNVWKSRCFHSHRWPDNEWRAQHDDDYDEHHIMGKDVFDNEADAVMQAIKNIDMHIKALGKLREEQTKQLFYLLCGEPLS